MATAFTAQGGGTSTQGGSRSTSVRRTRCDNWRTRYWYRISLSSSHRDCGRADDTGPCRKRRTPPHFQLTKPTPHKCLSISNNGHQPKLDGPQSSAVLCLLADLVQQLASRARVLIQLRDPGFTPEEVTARFSHEDFLSRLDQLLLGRVKLLA